MCSDWATSTSHVYTGPAIVWLTYWLDGSDLVILTPVKFSGLIGPDAPICFANYSSLSKMVASSLNLATRWTTEGGINAAGQGSDDSALFWKLVRNEASFFFQASGRHWVGTRCLRSERLNLWEGTPDNSKELKNFIQYDVTCSVSITLFTERYSTTPPSMSDMTAKAYSPYCNSKQLNAPVLMRERDNNKPFISMTTQQILCSYVCSLHRPKLVYDKLNPKGEVTRNRTFRSRDFYKFPGSSDSIQNLGYMKRLENFSSLPQWTSPPCTDIRASEGFLFPPRDYTKSDTVRLYREEMCRVIPLVHRKEDHVDGIRAGLYSPPSTVFDGGAANADNSCYCLNRPCPPKGLQDVSPCHDENRVFLVQSLREVWTNLRKDYEGSPLPKVREHLRYSLQECQCTSIGMPIYVSFPHFYGAEPSLREQYKGLQPNESKHGMYFVIQPTLGVAIHSAVRVQYNVKLTRAPNVYGNNTTSLPDVCDREAAVKNEISYALL
ncbi:Protein peste [Eumeta japonica]|uniref:Protein peste n=1 Tax=Eumeta variegata TaxID=151549 RepID=A0A4C1X0U8_EUMVA|nr:Protein peste [Eumeta japonica]